MIENFGNKKLGFGMMRLPQIGENYEKIDIPETCRMVDLFLERGFTYFDTAWMYCGFQSEDAVKEVLTKRHPRESFTLTTKLHAGFLDSKADRDRIFSTQMRKTGTDFFDYYLIHDVGVDHYKTYEKLGCFEWLMKKKETGAVRHAGFSFHDSAEFLDKVLTEHPEMEFVQLQVNYLDWENPGIQSRKCCEVAAKHGKPIIVMEPVKGGTLVDIPVEAQKILRARDPQMSIPSWAIRFAASQKNVKLVLSGMSDLAQVADNTAFMSDFQPLTTEDLEAVQKTVEFINRSIAIPCTGCSYCTDGCPQKIAIPQYFSLYNLDKQEIPGKDWQPQAEYYDRLTHVFGSAGSCVECGQCESACPQHLPIIRHLKEVAEYFGH
ncbi:MAG: aldo/keto reductase [Thermoguttaceae bacterium]|nr:aldo/keto reductase [Thermoguttaceae bacterium]